DSSLPTEVRKAALSELSPKDMDRMLLGVRELREPALVTPAFQWIADQVAGGRAAAADRRPFVTLLVDRLGNRALDPEIHQTAFEYLQRVGTPGDVLDGVSNYLRPDKQQPLDEPMLDYLSRHPDVIEVCRGPGDEAARHREALLPLLLGLIERRQGDTRANALDLFVGIAPPNRALEVAAAQHRAARADDEPRLRAALLGAVRRIDPAAPGEDERREATWLLAELIRAPGRRDAVATACAAVLDREEAGALCDRLYRVYLVGKGIDGKGTPPEIDEAADVVLLPYLAATRQAGRVEQVRDYVLGRVKDLAKPGADGRVPEAEELPFMLQALGRLRARYGPWREGLAALAALLGKHAEGAIGFDTERAVLGAITAFEGDAPIDFGPMRATLADRLADQRLRAPAARALGALHDPQSADLLRKTAADAGGPSSLRIASARALGELGGWLRRQGKPNGELTAYLRQVVQRRGDESDVDFVAAAVEAYGRAADPEGATVLFDLLLGEAYYESAMLSIHGLLCRTEEDCGAVTAVYLRWRAGRPKDWRPRVNDSPDDLFLAGSMWDDSRVPWGGVEAALRVVTAALARASSDPDDAVRAVAIDFRGELLAAPDAPPLDVRGGGPATPTQVKAWLAWWDANKSHFHLEGRRLVRVSRD
ncbi:MAG TPA: hypothetical protein VFW33_10365, partial [Gemmataceae bacterium]|nr:hypothetical protein [Gemmataceae bacterium]